MKLTLPFPKPSFKRSEKSLSKPKRNWKTHPPKNLQEELTQMIEEIEKSKQKINAKMSRQIYYKRTLIDGTWTVEPTNKITDANVDIFVSVTILDSGTKISTIFLGIDHSMGVGDEVLLFETMVFGGTYDEEQWRYPTEIDAKLHHDQIVDMIKSEEPPLTTLFRLEEYEL